ARTVGQTHSLGYGAAATRLLRSDTGKSREPGSKRGFCQPVGAYGFETPADVVELVHQPEIAEEVEAEEDYLVRFYAGKCQKLAQLLYQGECFARTSLESQGQQDG
ncbi:hypothetical protein J6590_064969, partial [Homalodisca vitripennis]